MFVHEEGAADGCWNVQGRGHVLLVTNAGQRSDQESHDFVPVLDRYGKTAATDPHPWAATELETSTGNHHCSNHSQADTYSLMHLLRRLHAPSLVPAFRNHLEGQNW